MRLLSPRVDSEKDGATGPLPPSWLPYSLETWALVQEQCHSFGLETRVRARGPQHLRASEILLCLRGLSSRRGPDRKADGWIDLQRAG